VVKILEFFDADPGFGMGKIRIRVRGKTSRIKTYIFSVFFSGQQLSREAASATTAGEIFNLFFSPEMLDTMVYHTNRCVYKTERICCVSVFLHFLPIVFNSRGGGAK
jgi:hypothetical protein